MYSSRTAAFWQVGQVSRDSIYLTSVRSRARREAFPAIRARKELPTRLAQGQRPHSAIRLTLPSGGAC